MDSATERIQTLCSHLTADQQEDCEEDEQLLTNEVSEEASSSNSQSLVTTGSSSLATGKDTVTVIDNRTGKSVEIPIYRETIQATELGKLGLRSFDPGYLNTSSARSKICYIDGDKGELWYRGYPIEILAERSTFLEVAYLLIYGELPVRSQLEDWETLVMSHTFIHTNLVQLLSNFRYDSHPMGIVISAMAALGTFYPECNPALAGNDVFANPEIRNKQIVRIMGKLPTIAACAYRHRIGRSYNEPMPGLSYTENFLCMLDRLQDKEYRPHPRLAHALDVLFILHADHELNCSTSAMRHITSANTDPYTAVAGSAAALYGPLHGGANEAVLRMLESIGTIDKVPAFIEQVKQRKKKLMGFGHRVYKSYDPRAKIIRQIAYEVFSILGDEPLILVALELEKIALNDEYFIKRKLYPNVDFYSGLIYRAMGFPTDMFPVLFAIPRAVGWLAHWNEQLDDSDTKIYRPRQIYEGSPIRDYIPISQREKLTGPVKIYTSNFSKRRSVAPRK